MSLVRRASPVVQWILAVALLVTAGVLGANAVREWRGGTGAQGARATSPGDAAPPTSAPPGAVRLPVLLLEGNVRVRLGDTASQVATGLGRGAEVGRFELERTDQGDRLVRFYQHRDVRFLLVFSLSESPQDPTVTGIFAY
jgi:hypothetical protein